MIFEDYKALLEQLNKDLTLTEEACQKILDNPTKENTTFYAGMIFELRRSSQETTALFATYPQNVHNEQHREELRRLIYEYIDRMKSPTLMETMNKIQVIVEEIYK